MKFGFMSEAETPENTTYLHRYHELIDEVQQAERMGFDFFACSEQHFTFGGAISAPECLFSYLFPLTSRIRFRHAVMLLPRRINHPLRVAERIATEDILSGGRIELGAGRSNTALIVRAFEVDPDRSRAEVHEALQIIRKAFTENPFSFEGEFFHIPKRYLVPRPIQQPHPPISIAATSPESMEEAAAEGFGVMTSSYFFGWRWLEILAEAYFNRLAMRDGSVQRTHFTPMLYTYCAETDDEARRDGAPAIYNAARLAVVAFTRLAELSQSYGYMAQAADIADNIGDFDWLIEESGTVVCGSPESCVEQIRRYVEIGANEIIIRLDGVPHDKMMRSLELLGKEVIPHSQAGTRDRPAGLGQRRHDVSPAAAMRDLRPPRLSSSVIEQYEQAGYWTFPTLSEYLESHASARPAAAAFADADGAVSWGELRQRVRALAAGLAERGVTAGDVVVVQLPNETALAVAMLAIHELGAVFVHFRLG